MREAGFGDRLMQMPDGIETCLYKDAGEDGVEVSGGEAQKVVLARAIYKNAPFIVLDEPTAARGTHSELLQMENGRYRMLWDAQAQYYR